MMFLLKEWYLFGNMEQLNFYKDQLNDERIKECMFVDDEGSKDMTNMYI